MKLILPLPPTVNHMYLRNPHGFGMYKSKEAKSWIAQCERIIKASGHRKTITGKISVDIRFYLCRNCDIDNRLKALLDILQFTALIENDKQIYSILARKDFDKQQPRVEMEVTENV